jgi:hypothetical protein
MGKLQKFSLDVMQKNAVIATTKGLFSSKKFHRNFEEFNSLGKFPTELVWFVRSESIGFFFHSLGLHAIP